MHPHRTACVIFAVFALLITSCARTPASPVEDPSGQQDFSRFALNSLKGTRDGERLTARAVFSDGSRELTVDLQFRVGPQTRLESGTWSGLGGSGAVHERSTTFLGGQSGPPSLGGRFDLQDAGGATLHRVTIPLQPLNDPL
ncbi:MAG TPA: hypothetical protein VER03_10480 [Bryobacteraceae bacterium]|nr:hypothetical protein [Bryobacteraceae bacterium]